MVCGVGQQTGKPLLEPISESDSQRLFGEMKQQQREHTMQEAIVKCVPPP